MAQQNLDDLLQAIHDAVIEAQTITEKQHIRQLQKYFNEDGTAQMLTIRVPSMKHDAADNETETLHVPMITLVPPSAIRIKQMKVDFKVALGSLDTKNDCKTLRVDIGGSGGLFGKTQNTANVEITFMGTDPPESFLRINDHLVKSIL